MATRLTRPGWPAVPGEASRRLALLGLIVALSLYLGGRYPNFHTESNAKAILLNSAPLLIAGVAAAALLISGNVDLSIGSQWAFGGMLAAWVAVHSKSTVLAVVAAIVVGGTMGLINGSLVRFLRISPLIVTLAMNLVWGGLAFVVASGEPITGLPSSFLSLGSRQVLGFSAPIVVAVIVFVIGTVLLSSTVLGMRVYAIGGNSEIARLTGVRVDRTIVGLYVLQGVAVAIVAIVTTAQLTSATPQTGATFSLDVLTAVILGGVAFNGGAGHPLGVLLGVLTIGVVDAGLIFMGLEDWYQQIARGGLLILALSADQVLANLRERGSLRRLTGRAVDVGVSGIAMPESTPLPPAQTRVGEVVLSVRDVSRNYGAVQAVAGAHFDVRAGEIVCLVGDNGAGKSTMVKMISGAVAPSSGSITLGGAEIPVGSPAGLRAAGVQTVFQELALCPNLSVVHNMVLADEPRSRTLGWLGIRDDRAAAQRTAERLARFGVDVPPGRRTVRLLSGGQRQAVAIARALKAGTRLVILDEPTAALGVRQTARVLEVVKSVAAEGTAVLLISHDLESVLAVADRVVVLRQGQVIYDAPTSALDRGQLVHLMAGIGNDVQTAVRDHTTVAGA